MKPPIKLLYDDSGRLVRYRPKVVKVKPVPKPVKKPSCPECGGLGSTQDGGVFSQFETCGRCHGTGLKSMAAIRRIVEERERKQLARLMAKYPDAKTI